MVILLLLALYPLRGEGSGEAGMSLDTLLSRADRAARKARYELRTEAQMREALQLYLGVLERDPDNRRALSRLSLGYFTLAEAYISGKKKKKSAYSTGYKYGLSCLKTNEDFAEAYEQKGFAALKKIPQSVDNVEALFWTGANLGRKDETEGVMKTLNDLPALIALNRRVIKLDESYLGGGAHRALASIASELLSRLPWTFLQVNNNNFSWSGAREHFERAIELAPNCLENYFSYAKYYALKRGEKKLARELLNRVIESQLGDDYPLINAVAKEKARSLKDEKL